MALSSLQRPKGSTAHPPAPASCPTKAAGAPIHLYNVSMCTWHATPAPAITAVTPTFGHGSLQAWQWGLDHTPQEPISTGEGP